MAELVEVPEMLNMIIQKNCTLKVVHYHGCDYLSAVWETEKEC
jgi:hypothetical protein